MTKWRWKNFTRDELKCKGTGEFLINEDALDKLQKMREIVGKPFVINSAYRSPSHNKAVGGAQHSLHTQGRAFDIRIGGHNPIELYNAAKQAGFTGFGFHQSFLHVDTGNPRSWEYGGNPAKHLYIPENAPKWTIPKTDSNPDTENPILIEQQSEGYIAPPEPKKAEKVAIATAGVGAGAGVIELLNQATPVINAASYLSWQTAAVVVAGVIIVGGIWYFVKSRRG